MEYLNEVKAKLEDVMEELNIFTLSIDEEINKILVETDVISDEFKSQIYEIADDAECIEFGVTSQPIPMADPVFNGQQAFYSEGDKTHYFSIGMGIQLYDGRVGWLTAGHCWTSDIYNYVQSSSCGTLIGQFDPILHAYGEQGDYAFIERPNWLHYIKTTNMFAYRQSTDRWNTSGNINDLGSGISWGYPKNTSVTAYGSVTRAQDGVIKNTNLTVKYNDGTKVSHLISMTGKTEGGDSGGPVAVKMVGAGTGSAVIGIISGGVGMWPTRIYFTDMEHIYNQLGGFEGHADYIRW